ncbi:MAG: glycosyltransferase [Muribaculaceae bacterium]|nr:glycosyltransferase [Muribaculaceae bacterium]
MQVDLTKELSLVTETSWEVCNKIGGIYAVLSTKAKELKAQFGDNLVFIGPDVWTDETPSRDFIERKTLLKRFSSITLPFDIKVRTGRWDIPGSPLVVLVKFDGVYPHLNEIYGKMWELFGVDSLHAYGDYAEGCAFGIASAIVSAELCRHLGINPNKMLSHFNEWTTGMGLLYLRMICPEAASVFTTHATSIGRSICGNGKALYQYFTGYNGDQMAYELNMEAKHSLEKQAAKQADCFTTVSEVTARECAQLLDTPPAVVTPNGFEPAFVPDSKKGGLLRRAGRKRLLDVARSLTGKEYDKDTLIIGTSGRNEYRNKGLDLFIDSIVSLNDQIVSEKRKAVAFIMVPAWVKSPDASLEKALKDKGVSHGEQHFMTHRLHNEESDSVSCRVRAIYAERGELKTDIIYLPCYLDGKDGIVNISYYDLLPALDVTVFGSYYEPWGYTPLESIAFGVPTITTDKAGFGQWILDNFPNSLEETGVCVIPRNDDDYTDSVADIAGELREYYFAKECVVKKSREAAMATSRNADWKYFITTYDKAFSIAIEKRNEREITK